MESPLTIYKKIKKYTREEKTRQTWNLDLTHRPINIHFSFSLPWNEIENENENESVESHIDSHQLSRSPPPHPLISTSIFLWRFEPIYQLIPFLQNRATHLHQSPRPRLPPHIGGEDLPARQLCPLHSPSRYSGLRVVVRSLTWSLRRRQRHRPLLLH